MRNIKTLVLFILATFVTTEISAQGIRIYKKDSTVVEYSYADIDSLVAIPAETKPDTVALQFVDLGLSVKWANMNIGAKTPEDFGDYFAWGEITTKDSYTYENSLTYTKERKDFSGDPKYDAAAAIIGDGARMPTLAEIKELIDNTTTEIVEVNGVTGRKVTSKKNGNSIFLPSAGTKNGVKTSFLGVYGHYWTSTPGDGTDHINAHFLDSTMQYFDWNVYNRFHGNCIRAVHK